MKHTKKVILAMSGGVDSSVAALLLLQSGYFVEGVFMKNWEEDDSRSYCSSKKDFEDAQEICNYLNIKLHTINFSEEYWNKVFLIFLKEYSCGNTPNPDILCNSVIKFNLFMNFSIKCLHADYIATGHYAIIKKIFNTYKLYRSFDIKKDQTYFLYTLSSKKMSKILFPVGHLKKKIIRKIAKKNNFKIAKKKDSTGICFIPPQKFSTFLEKYIPKKIGIIMTMSQEVVGNHNGIAYYTIGQRKGLNIGGRRNSMSFNWYVVKKNINLNIIFVVQGARNPYLLFFGLIITKPHWIEKIILYKKIYCMVQIRHCHPAIDCYFILLKKNKVKVIFKKPELAISQGQSAVFYKFDCCLGGGIISKGIPYLPE